MEELTASLASSFAVSNDPNTTAAPHPRYAQYKQKCSQSDQEHRRKSILDKQKSRRFDFMNHVRRLAENAWENDDDDEAETGENEEAMDDSEIKAFHKPGRYYKNQLMLSEWLVEVPSNLPEEWLMVVCPVGKRCLVVASKGTTNAYARNGYRINTFPSWLPGGNRKQQSKFRDNAILDCIYHEVDKTFYVLDIMCWKNHPVYDSETEFRFYWLKSRFEETPEATMTSNVNPYKFIPLPYWVCCAEQIRAALDSTQQEVDGCLFYHKKVCYTFGSVPLVLWLKPYMFQEILGLEVPVHMMEQKPAQYQSYPQYMQHLKDFKEQRAVEREKKKSPQKPGGNRHGRKKGAQHSGGDMEVTADDTQAEPLGQGHEQKETLTESSAEQMDSVNLQGDS